MKSLLESMKEALLNERFTPRDWRCKKISFSEMVDLAKTALDVTKVDPDDICAELGSYKDPDDLWNAFDRGNLSNTSKWMDHFTEMIKDGSHSGDQDEIASDVFDILYDLMYEIKTKKL